MCVCMFEERRGGVRAWVYACVGVSVYARQPECLLTITLLLCVGVVIRCSQGGGVTAYSAFPLPWDF